MLYCPGLPSVTYGSKQVRGYVTAAGGCNYTVSRYDRYVTI